MNRALFFRSYGFFLLFVPVSKYWVCNGLLHASLFSALSEVLGNFKLSAIIILDFQFAIVKVLRHYFKFRCHSNKITRGN